MKNVMFRHKVTGEEREKISLLKVNEWERIYELTIRLRSDLKDEDREQVREFIEDTFGVEILEINQDW